jgi:chromosome segregation ATPase
MLPCFNLKTLILTLAALIVVSGCSLQEQKNLERENADLKANLRQNTELLNQAQAKEKKQTALITTCQEKIGGLEKKVADLDMLKVELRKQKEYAESEVIKLKAENQKLSTLIENYKTQIKSLNDQLDQARKTIQDLQDKIKALTTTKPAAKEIEK